MHFTLLCEEHGDPTINGSRVPPSRVFKGYELYPTHGSKRKVDTEISNPTGAHCGDSEYPNRPLLRGEISALKSMYFIHLMFRVQQEGFNPSK